MKNKTTLALLAAAALLAAVQPAARAYQPDYARDVRIDSDPSPVNQITGSSVNQFGAGQVDSQIDNYAFQDEQINLDDDSGTVRVLRTNQKAVINNYVTAFVPLNNVNPRELRGLARTICRKEGGDADVLQDKQTGRNGMIVVCPPHLVPYIGRTLQSLDFDWIKEYNDGSWYIYYKGKFRDVRNIMQTLAFYRSPDGTFQIDEANNAVVIFDQPNVEPLVALGTKSTDIPPSQILLDVAVYELDTQNDLALGLDWESWKNGPGRNLFELAAWNFGGDNPGALFPGDLPANASDWGSFRSYDFFLSTAYIDFLQVKGKARQVTKATIAAKSGTVGEVSAVDQVLAFQSQTGPQPTPLTGRGLFRLSDLLDYYVETGDIALDLDAKLKEDEVIAAVDVVFGILGIAATDTVKIKERLRERGRDGCIDRDDLDAVSVPLGIVLEVFRNRTLRTVNAGQIGVLLSVLPVVGLESAEVALALDVSGVTGYAPSGTPVIEHRYLASQIQLRDGQPFILGGLKRETTVQSASGIPYLRDIKYLGYLFGREVTTRREKELVVLITPRFKLCPMDEPNPPRELSEAVLLATGKKELQVPKTAFGFDQWLLNGVAERRMNAVD